MKAKLDKFSSLGGAWSGTDEEMVQLDPHTSKSTQSELPRLDETFWGVVGKPENYADDG